MVNWSPVIYWKEPRGSQEYYSIPEVQLSATEHKQGPAELPAPCKSKRWPRMTFLTLLERWYSFLSALITGGYPWLQPQEKQTTKGLVLLGTGHFQRDMMFMAADRWLLCYVSFGEWETWEVFCSHPGFVPLSCSGLSVSQTKGSHKRSKPLERAVSL